MSSYLGLSASHFRCYAHLTLLDSPLLGMLLDELFHQVLTLGIFQIDDLDTIALQMLLSTYEGVVLAHDDSRDFVQYAGAGTHVTRGECGVHCGAFVCTRW